MTRHVDAEALGRYSEGDLSQRRAARVAAHLAGCSRCAGLSEQLAGVTALLASTQAPPIPEHLAARIQNTLATESARRIALDPGTEPGRRDLPARGRLPARNAGPRRRLPGFSSPLAQRSLAAAGAITVIAAIAVGGYAILQHHQPQHSSSAGGPASSQVAPSVQAGARAPSAAPAVGPMTFGPSLHYSIRGQQDNFVPVSTSRNYVPASLTAQVSSTLTQVRNERPAFSRNSTAVGSSSRPASSSPAAGTSLTTPASQFDGVPVDVLEQCVSRIAAGHLVLLVDVARYLGGPATLIVVEASAADQVWVVGPACSGSDRDVLAQRNFPRG